MFDEASVVDTCPYNSFLPYEPGLSSNTELYTRFRDFSRMNYNQDQFMRYHAPQRSFSFESDYTIRNGEKVYLGRAIPSLGVVLESIQRGFKRRSETMAKKDQVQGEEWENQKRSLDPQGPFLQRWNKIFVISCLIAVALDALFLYIPVMDGDRKCLTIDKSLGITACVLRSSIDLFYILHIIFSFRTGFIAPSSRVFGRGALVHDPLAIAKRYLSSYFLVDILSILPLPQVAILFVVPLCRGPQPMVTKETLMYIIFLQYVPRLFRIYPLFEEVTTSSGILTETAWGGAAFNLLLYLLASHIVGACWYLFSVAREEQCWLDECSKKKGCNSTFLYCQGNSLSKADNPFKDLCKLIKPDDIKEPGEFNFGIFFDAVRSRIVQSKDFRRKFSYCFWWGLRNVSSLGSNLQTSTFPGEIAFAASITIFGLILFALLIGNMQKYLESTTMRIEEMRVRRRDAEHWMSHRMLPEPLRDRVRRYEQYKWQETRGVEEDGLVSKLPKDLRRDIKRHLSLDLLMKVPLFQTMDEQLVDAMCDCLKPMLYTENSSIIREGDPVDLMLFIMRGNLKTTTTYGGKAGFFNTVELKPGDFCGDELLTWALDPTPNSLAILPCSTRTVESLTEVEAFALEAEDLKSVASQFRRLHSEQLRYTFRFYSLQWRTWAACVIQASWRRYLRIKHEKSLREAENRLQNILRNKAVTSTRLSFRASIFAARFAANLLGSRRGVGSQAKFSLIPALPPQRPSEPDFTS